MAAMSISFFMMRLLISFRLPAAGFRHRLTVDHGAVGLHQVGGGNALDVLRGHALDPARHLVDHVGVAPQGLQLGQGVGAAQDVFQAVVPVGHHAGLHALEGGVVDAVFRDLGDLFVHRGQHGVGAAVRLVQAGDGEQGRAVILERAGQAEAAGDVQRDLAAFHQALVEQRGIAAGQQLGQHGHRGLVGAAAGRDFPGGGHGRHLGQGVALLDAFFLGVQAFGKVGRFRRRTLRDAAEVFLGQREALGRGDVAGDRQHRVVRAVVVAVEAAHVVQAGAFEVFEAAVAVVVVLPLVEGQLADVDPVEAAVRLVLHVHADLFLHHVLLVLQRGRVEVEGLHAVRFQPQDRLDGGHRRGLDVVGEVRTGRTVVVAAAAGDGAVEHALRRIRRALEHQVFEQVGEAGAVARLEAHADVVDDRHADGGRAVVFGDDDRQAVVELLDVDRQGPLVAVRGGADIDSDAPASRAGNRRMRIDNLL
jgi:uncharacterized membrane protein (DUF2068 family)